MQMMHWLKTKYLWLFVLLTICLMADAFAAANKKPLPTEQAFVLSVKVKNANEIVAQWQIAPGYYLYRQRLHISLIPRTNAEIVFPQGKLKRDLQKIEEVYTGKLTIPILLHTRALQSTQLNIEYQGCSESGFCYPPVTKDITVNWDNFSSSLISRGNQETAASRFDLGLSSLLTDHQRVQTVFATHHIIVMMLIFAGLGLLLAFTPCVLPMVPILTSIIVGHHTINTKKAFLLSLTYVLGTSITYAMAGVAAALMGASLQLWLQQTWVIVAISGLFVLLAFSLFGFYELSMPSSLQNRLSRLSRQQKSGTYFGVFATGVVSALIVTPCVTAPLVGVLMYIADTGNVLLGASALFMLGIGMGIPLLLVGLSAGRLLPKSGPWMEGIKKIFGVIMLGMAIWLLDRIATPATIIIFCGLLLLGVTLYFRLRRAWVGLASYAATLLSIILLVGGIAMPHALNGWILGERETSSPFVVVHDMKDLKKQLAEATASHKPVMLDFYADWCESCVTMDKKVFNVPAVRQALEGFVLLRADLTANNAEDEAMLKNFKVVAPPTVLFFNKQGQEVNAHRIVGEVNEKEFTLRLDTFISARCDKNLPC